jgi:hypothetical protein
MCFTFLADNDYRAWGCGQLFFLFRPLEVCRERVSRKDDFGLKLALFTLCVNSAFLGCLPAAFAADIVRFQNVFQL